MSDYLSAVPLMKLFHKPCMTCKEFIDVIHQKIDEGVISIECNESFTDKDLAMCYTVGILAYAGVGRFNSYDLIKVASVVAKEWWGDYE